LLTLLTLKLNLSFQVGHIAREMELSLRLVIEFGKKLVSVSIAAGARQHNAGDLGVQIGKK